MTYHSKRRFAVGGIEARGFRGDSSLELKFRDTCGSILIEYTRPDSMDRDFEIFDCVDAIEAGTNS